MKILVINCGSSSLKYQVFNMEKEEVLAKGNVEKIGIEGSFIKYKNFKGFSLKEENEINDHNDAIKLVFNVLTDDENGVIKDVSEIDAIGHRVVHAGEKYAGSVLITKDVKDALKECIELAPLHNPPNIIGIEACEAIMPDVQHVGVFDTAFHQTMPKKAFLYGLPYEFYEKYGLRRYGFHGTSHKYVASRAAKILDKPLDELKIVTCHLGNGASITAVEKGKSVDTSMGFTPLEGLIMGTRCGDIDPAIVPFLMDKENLNTDEINNLMNKESGVLGISGVSNDFRTLEDAASDGNELAKVALDAFAYKVRKYIGSYVAAMDGVDAIVFTAGIGENSDVIREMVCSKLSYLGVKIDEELNGQRGRELDISKNDAEVRVLVIPTNEELMIARDTQEIIENL
ncbi:MAG: acetate/propionate family kinase [Clostridia bacterium]